MGVHQSPPTYLSTPKKRSPLWTENFLSMMVQIVKFNKPNRPWFAIARAAQDLGQQLCEQSATSPTPNCNPSPKTAVVILKSVIQ